MFDSTLYTITHSNNMATLGELPLDELVRRLKKDPGKEANKEFAKRVYNNNGDAVVYYMTDMNEKHINILSNTVMHRDIFTEYYEFLSNPLKGREPQWDKVRRYKGFNEKLDSKPECSLKSYTSIITSRHFWKIARKEQKIKEKPSDIVYIDYMSLKSCYVIVDNIDEDPDSKVVLRKKGLRIAFEQLSEVDRLILKYLAIECMSTVDAYELLSDHINPKVRDGFTSAEVKEAKSKYQKSTDLSVKKGRALRRLEALYNDVRENERNGLYNLHFYYDATIYFSDQSSKIDNTLKDSLTNGFNKLPLWMQTILKSRLKDKMSPVKVYDLIRTSNPKMKVKLSSSLKKDEKIVAINIAMGEALKLWESYC